MRNRDKNRENKRQRKMITKTMIEVT